MLQACAGFLVWLSTPRFKMKPPHVYCFVLTFLAVQGDNLILGSFDRRLSWFDLDLSVRPYKVLRFVCCVVPPFFAKWLLCSSKKIFFFRYHREALRQVSFHSTYPLFASCSDDATIHIFHGMVYNDLLQNPLIVPVKVFFSVFLLLHPLCNQLSYP